MPSLPGCWLGNSLVARLFPSGQLFLLGLLCRLKIFLASFRQRNHACVASVEKSVLLRHFHQKIHEDLNTCTCILHLSWIMPFWLITPGQTPFTKSSCNSSVFSFYMHAFDHNNRNSNNPRILGLTALTTGV